MTSANRRAAPKRASAAAKRCAADRVYWEDIAPAWEDEIFNVLGEDQDGVLEAAVRRFARRDGTAVDYGCGIGRCLPLLSSCFGSVHGLDWARACVARCAARCARLRNVQVSLPTPRALDELEGRSDLTLLVNVVMRPGAAGRARLVRSAASVTARGGALVVVVPSLEAVVMAEAVRRECSPRVASRFDFRAMSHWREPGIIAIDGVPTKHYTADELVYFLRRAGLVDPELSRVQYAWRVESVSPPRGAGLPRPWDWMVIARRPGGRRLSAVR